MSSGMFGMERNLVRARNVGTEAGVLRHIHAQKEGGIAVGALGGSVVAR